MLAHCRLIATTLLALALSLVAQTQSKPPANKQTTGPDAPLYQNLLIGFRYQIPYGWVDRSQQMRSEKTAGQDAHSDDASQSRLLLAVFERPPDATGDTINSAVVIASESAASYPDLKKAEDYLGPLTELAIAHGFKADGEPYAIEVESRQLLRADFIKPLGGTDHENGKLTMHQCTLVLLTKGQIVSFTFLAGSDDELDDLMDGLHFTTVKPSPR
jgi:hypothetical protein